MGAVCSAGFSDENTKNLGFSGKLKKGATSMKENFSYSDEIDALRTPHKYDSGELRSSFSSELKPSTPARTGAPKISQRNSFIGRAGIAGLEKAVGVLDTLGSSVSNLQTNSGFLTGGSRGCRISILSFEVANTIAKGANLLQSLSEKNIQFLKGEVMHSLGVQNLVSKNMRELLSIASADKREELDLFSREVIRFGDLCKDPQWHNLSRYFTRLDSDDPSHEMLRSEAEMTMQELTTIAQHTSELYHELNSLDRFEQDYRRKLEEAKALHLPLRGESLTMLQSELKQQRKLVRALKKKSLWAKNLDEIVEKLVDIVAYIHQAISEAFGDNGLTHAKGEKGKNPQRLGTAGLALHYANMINQIDNIASRPTSLPPNTRDNLYHGLPDSVKKALRSRLQTLDAKEELTVSQVKAEMEKTLHWLVPVASNTNKAHQGFGWVGEWANSGTEFGKNSASETNLVRLQTLYHADKQKTDAYILELVTWLHQLINLVRHCDHGLKPLPIRSPTRKGLDLHSKMQRMDSIDYSTNKTKRIQISEEDRNLLEDVIGRMKRVPGISKSQEFAMSKKRGTKAWALSKSTGSSPPRELNKRGNLDQLRANSLDIIDGLG
ncbi:protein PSK SIMULATOR 2 [Argentina anserina]|uniref:protein PSK SIMULATOR 2 n=1 Tax=Argentina anserina TaxID=57926 RepID=UPI0021767020|nr:protein PSK SIMULATOR 2 [Potentilla anserina]